MANPKRPVHFWEQVPGGLERLRIKGGWLWKDPSSGSLAFVPHDAAASDAFDWPAETEDK